MTQEQLVQEIEAARKAYRPGASADMVAVCSRAFLLWAATYGREYADACGDPENSQFTSPDEQPRGARRQRRSPRREPRRGRRQGTWVDQATRRRLSAGLHRSCLSGLRVPADVIEQIVPSRPQGVSGWLSRVFGWLGRSGAAPAVPAGYEQQNDAAMVVVTYLRSDLRQRPEDLRSLVLIGLS